MNQLFYDFIIFEDIFLHKPMLWAGFYNLGFGNLDPDPPSLLLGNVE